MQRIQLDPSIQTVWETPTVFRFGIHQAIVTLDNPPLRIERLIDALRSGMPSERLPQIASALGVSRSEQIALLDTLTPVLTPETFHDDQNPSQLALALVGDSVAGKQLMPALLAEGFSVSDSNTPDIAILVSHFVTPIPIARRWSTRGIPHLPIVFSEHHVTLGPVVGAHGNPCTFCVELSHADREPNWAAIASQCLGRSAATATPKLIAITTGLLLDMLQQWRRHGDTLPSAQHQLRYDTAGGITVLSLPVSSHPRCDCHGFGS